MSKKNSFEAFQSSSSSEQDPQQQQQNSQSEENNEEESSENNQSEQDNLYQQGVYPFTKKDSAQLFRTKGDKFAYDQDEVYDQMKACLLDLEKYGFDFRCISWQFEPQEDRSRSYKKFNRKIYLKFKCPECKEDSRPKSWTSILGNLEIRFQIQSLRKFWKENEEYREQQSVIKKMKYPSILKWMLKIYVEYCEDCGNAGEPFVYESQLKACQIQFCMVVTNILNYIEPNQNKGNRNKLMEVHHHKEQLCEACQLGECYNIPKGTVQQERNKQL